MTPVDCSPKKAFIVFIMSVLCDSHILVFYWSLLAISFHTQIMDFSAIIWWHPRFSAILFIEWGKYLAGGHVPIFKPLGLNLLIIQTLLLTYLDLGFLTLFFPVSLENFPCWLKRMLCFWRDHTQSRVSTTLAKPFLLWLHSKDLQIWTGKSFLTPFLENKIHKIYQPWCCFVWFLFPILWFIG